LWLPAQKPAAAVTLGLEGARFTLDSKPAFLLGASYYGGLGASDETLAKDLDALKASGCNWVRVWATWAAFENDVAAVDAEGRPREAFVKRLTHLTAEADRRGMVVDVSLSRGNGVTGPPKLATHEAHRRAVETVIAALKPHRNWYLDLSNERNIRDKRYTSFEELAALRKRARELAPTLLVTASQGGDLSREDLDRCLNVGLDFVAPHRPRDRESPRMTAAKTREYLAWMKELGRTVPVHYQEPFRRGYTDWRPTVEDFLTDLRGAREAGAAGWCFHNGDQRDRPDGRPRRSFDLQDGPLTSQLDEVELGVLRKLTAP
jgi:hypothetical protein